MMISPPAGNLANTAVFHFCYIEQGGSNLYPALALKVTNREVLRVLLGIGPTETSHFQTWHDKAGNAVSTPLAAIAYVDAEGSPFMFCIIANEAPDAPMGSEQRGELSLASWSREGRGYLVIGRVPEGRAVAFAETLEKRI